MIQGFPEIVNYLLDNGAWVEAVNTDDLYRQAIHYAIIHEQIDLIETIIFNGADINAVDETGDTPIIIAARINPNNGIVDKLLSLGANIETSNDLL